MESMTRLTVLRKIFDLLLSPQTTLNSAQSFVLSRGEIAVFYRAAHACFFKACPADVKLDLAICDVNNQLFGILDLNYRPQNDFRFAIVSTDDLEFGPVLCTK